jgi:AraC-like DNA-binding protein
VKDITTLADFSLLDGFIISGGNRRIPDLFLEYPHSVEGLAVSICTEGHKKVKIGLREQEITPGTLIVLIPDLIIEPLEKSKDISLKTIFFFYDFISELQLPSQFNIIEKIMASPCIRLSDKDYATLLRYYAFIEEQYVRYIPDFKPTVIRNLLFALLGEILSLYSIRETKFLSTGHAEKLVNLFIEVLLKNYKSEHTVSFYADKLCVTPKYLTTVIKQNTGKSMSTWINNALIAHSKRELKTTDNSILLISEELDFSSSSQFCRYFKKHTGFTPKQYRDSEDNL